MNDFMASRKRPRDFVFIDDFWDADEAWDEYYLNQSVWVFMDEYHATLAGDEDYCRIIVYSSSDRGWKYSRRLKEREHVHAVSEAIKKPVSEKNLMALGFEPWSGAYI